MVFDMLEELENDKIAKIVMVLWTLWWKSNQKFWHDRNPSNLEVLRRAWEALQEWCRAGQHAQRYHTGAECISTCIWSKPPL
jgi:hypothetical protein